MKPGDLVRIIGSAPVYPDTQGRRGPGDEVPVAYMPAESVCVLLDVAEGVGSKGISFHRILTAEHGLVLVRSVWVEDVR